MTDQQPPSTEDNIASAENKLAFQETTAETPSLGKQLSDARKKKELSVGDVANALKLPTVYIEAIENDNYDPIASPVYARGYVRSYSKLLNLDTDILLRVFNAQIITSTSPVVDKNDPFELYNKQIKTKESYRPWILYGGLGFASIVLLLGAMHLYKAVKYRPTTQLHPTLLQTSAATATTTRLSTALPTEQKSSQNTATLHTPSNKTAAYKNKAAHPVPSTRANNPAHHSMLKERNREEEGYLE